MTAPRKGPAWQQAMARYKDEPPQSAALAALLTDNYKLVCDTNGDPYAVDLYRAPGVAIPLRGKKGLRQRLAADMFEMDGWSPSSEALSNTLNLIEGMADQARPQRLAVRVARAGQDQIALDLGGRDGTAALIRPGSWELTTRGPALFRRSPAGTELPEPVAGPQRVWPTQAFSLINITDRDALALYTGCRLASLIPEGTRPVELMMGQPGAIKTGSTRISVWWVGGRMAKMPRDPREWAAYALSIPILGHDNVSKINAERQDLLCAAATGDSHLARALYSDADLFAADFQPVTTVINGVETNALQTDVIRRAVIHYLLKPGAWLPEKEVSTRWAASHGYALGWLLTLLADVLERMPLVKRPDGDTLSDFAWVLAALDSLWGTHSLELWRASQGALYAEMAESDPLAMAIMEVITVTWAGTAKDLLTKLEAKMPSSPVPGRPWTPQMLSRSLDRCTAGLEALGWTVARPVDLHTKRRAIVLTPGGGNGAVRDWPGAVALPYRPGP
jgi:hypothetical protein